MKVFIAVATLLIGPASAQDKGSAPVEEPQAVVETRNVRYEFLVVQMAQDLGLTLIPGLRDQGRSEKAVAELCTGIARDEIKLLGIATTVSKDRHRALAECREEIRFPAEHETVIGPPTFADPPAKAEPSAPRTFFRHDIDIPTGWGTREVGLILEAEVIPSGSFSLGGSGTNSDLISLAVNAQFVELREMRRFLADAPPGDSRTWYAQPQFRTAKLGTALQIPLGKWQLMHVSVVPDQGPAIRLFLLRCTVLPVGK